MPLAADTIQDHASQIHARPHLLTAEHQGGGRAAHGCDVQNQQDGTCQRPCHRGRASLLPGADTVEQAHDSLDHRDVGIAYAAAEDGREGGLVQQPDVEVARRPASRLPMEARIDVVRAGPERCRPCALTA